ncbi:L-type lectin-domain containing receptor kinase IV.2-like [Mercurialis annua]|uniref:L-type lectin-domain containing receptor kinase IV.2-like n=1 Tax=Mercurialis annua TaxID=3986 RepID=UPI002160AD36|nr:L-type lectin-domain containing receptor kinase IV.2-like [Mercurialis annua]
MFSILELLLILLCSSVFLKHSGFAQVQHKADNFIYHGFNESNLNLNGIAKIHSDGLLELTNISYYQIGRAFSRFPLDFHNSSFSTNFVFAIHPEMANLGGHGFVFTISPSPEFTGALAAEYFGLFSNSTIGLDSNHVFAVEFDTIQTPDFGDIDNHHVGIDVNDLVSNVSASAAYFFLNDQLKSLELIRGNQIQVWIDYDEVEQLVNVTLAPIPSMKPEKPLLSTKINLSLVLTDSMYVGFSSSTGSMASYHYILGWSFNKSGPAQDLNILKLPSPPSLPPLPSKPKSGKKVPVFKIMVLLIIASILGTIIFGGVYIRRKKYEELHEDWEEEYGPQRFSYKDIYKATEGFKDKGLLGSGGFGKVYKGVLPCSDIQVAVKKFSHDSGQGMKQFVAEIASMGRLRHRNLVQLLGYCRRKGELLLVYGYVPNGSLDRFLFQSNTPTLNWVQRYQILKGVASALLYLHEEGDRVLLHRDVKASNVMLDADFIGKLGDFGLAKFYDHGSFPQTTCIVGTIGYLAPEVSRTGRATTGSDVFAYGILMLEVACGRKTIEPHRPHGEVILLDWVLDFWKRGVIVETSDLQLEGKYMVEEMELVLKLGLLCAHSTPAVRPTMRQVMQYLDGKAVIPDIPLDSSRTTNEDLISSYSSASKDCFSFSITASILSYGR